MSPRRAPRPHSSPRASRPSARGIAEEAAALENSLTAVFSQLSERVEQRQRLHMVLGEYRERFGEQDAIVAQLREQHERLFLEAERTIASTTACSQRAHAEVAQRRRAQADIRRARAQSIDTEVHLTALEDELALEEESAKTMERLEREIEARLHERAAVRLQLRTQLTDRAGSAAQLQREVLALRRQLGD
eukprot:CAMPEP_0119415522 /NCGR_PEP_ID=MMETSP1335-20130426/9498_1 /TAXON_ID=259385 /ORGANISM="Chrysoculter rhomboideus, Strain RCC1486" /LENGTH=190 /DNA_ID=CAMNT_0007440525 /DNA_START=30 /DNA_END=602 /DNA_ORIENTATION=-